MARLAIRRKNGVLAADVGLPDMRRPPGATADIADLQRALERLTSAEMAVGETRVALRAISIHPSPRQVLIYTHVPSDCCRAASFLNSSIVTGFPNRRADSSVWFGPNAVQDGSPYSLISSSVCAVLEENMPITSKKSTKRPSAKAKQHTSDAEKPLFLGGGPIDTTVCVCVGATW